MFDTAKIFGCVVDQRGKLADQLLRPSFFVYPGCKFSHTSTEEEAPKKLTGTNRLVTNNEKKKKRGSFWLTTNKLVFWKIVLAQSRQTDTDIKHRGGGMYV